MLELFKAYSKLHKKIRFSYVPDGGNAGVKDVQAGRSQFAINTRPPLPSDSGTTYVKLFLDGLCIAVNKSNPQQRLADDAEERLYRCGHQLEPGGGLFAQEHNRPDRS